MKDLDIELLKKITAPYAYTNEHVQGPGGNTSVKHNGRLIIKASGYTFKDVAESAGVVWLNNQDVLDTLLVKAQEPGLTLENAPPATLQSVPDGLKPSMEFEFHALLNTFVLHTHSVYTNVITCSKKCAELLAKLFLPEQYCLVPYVTPGYPIAEQLVHYAQRGQPIPPVIFLQNHGVIVHADTAEQVILLYNQVEKTIVNYFNFPVLPDLDIKLNGNQQLIITKNELLNTEDDFSEIIKILTTEIFIPDQSIFFKNKISTDNQNYPEIYVDLKNEQLLVTGSNKFIEACVAMLQAVFYIKNNIKTIESVPNFIPADQQDIMHSLAMEKHRITTLKNR